MASKKRHSQSAQMKELDTQVSKIFAMMIQLSKELQFVVNRQETMLTLLKELPGYEEALDSIKAKEESQQENEGGGNGFDYEGEE